jgi:hypothetical protein
MDKLLREVAALRETGDLGDRMMLGLPYTAGGGVINPGTDTFSSPNTSQNPDEFDVDGGPDAHKNIEPDSNTPHYQYASDDGIRSDINNGLPDKTPNPKQSLNSPVNPTNYSPDIQSSGLTDMQAGIDDIKYKVTPDQVIAGKDAELRNMVFKRPSVANDLVVQNLKTDPEYYSKLKFLNIDDDLMEEFKHKTIQEIAVVRAFRETAAQRNKRRNQSYE